MKYMCPKIGVHMKLIFKSGILNDYNSRSKMGSPSYSNSVKHSFRANGYKDTHSHSFKFVKNRMDALSSRRLDFSVISTARIADWRTFLSSTYLLRNLVTSANRNKHSSSVYESLYLEDWV